MKALNNLKDTLKQILGETTDINSNDFTSIITGIGAGDDIKNSDEIAVKVKNAVSHLLKFPIAFDPKTKIQVKTSDFKVRDIDINDDEIVLQDLINKIPVIVEFPESEREYYKEKSLQENDKVTATLFSIIDQNGLTAEWRLLDIDKI